MASGKQIGTVLVLVVLLGGLAAAAGFGSYFLMSAETDGPTHVNAEVAEDGTEGTDGTDAAADPDAPTDEEILADLADMGNADDTGSPRVSVRDRMKASGKLGKNRGKGKSGKAKTRVNPKSSTVSKTKQTCGKVPGIYKHSSTHYTLTQAFVDKYIKDMKVGQQQGSAGWSTDSNGKRRGVRLKRLKCAPREAGLRNKDTVASIAGTQVTTTAAALLAYKTVKSADSFEIKLYRKGTPMTIRYDVGDPPPQPAEGAGDAAEGDEADAAAPAGEGEGAAEGSAAEGADEEPAE